MPKYKEFPHKENQPKLLDVMNRYRVNIEIVAGLLDKSPDTIRAYRSVAGRNINNAELERLEFKLAATYGKH